KSGAHESVGAARGLGKAERDHAAAAARLCAQGDRAVTGTREIARELRMTVQILPAVRGADVAGAEVKEWSIRSETHRSIAAARIGNAIPHPGGVVAAGAAQM